MKPCRKTPDCPGRHSQPLEHAVGEAVPALSGLDGARHGHAVDHRAHAREVHHVGGVDGLPRGAQARVDQKVMSGGELQEQNIQRSPNVSSHAHERNSTDGRVREPKPHDLGLQISCCLHSGMSTQHAVSRVAPASGRSVPQARPPKGIEGRGRASDARSHAAFDPAEIRGVAGCRLRQGARARSTWPGFMESANGILSGNIFGRADSS